MKRIQHDEMSVVCEKFLIANAKTSINAAKVALADQLT